MAIIKSKDVIEVDKITQDLKKVREGIDQLTASNKKLSESLQKVKKSNDGTEAKALIKTTNALTKSTVNLKDAKRASVKVEEQVFKANIKLVESQRKEAEQLAKIKLEQSDVNKLNKASAVINNKLAGTEEKLLAVNTKLRLQRKKLIETDKNYSRNLKKINDQLDKNTRKIKASSDAMKKQKMTIGDYGTALKGLGTKLIGAFAAVKALQGAFDLLKNIIGSTAQGQIFLAKVTGATNVILATFRDMIIDSWSSLIKFGEEADKSRTFIEKLSDSFFDFYSVRGKGFLKFIGSATDIIKGNFSDALTNINDGFIQMTLGIESATKQTTEFINKMKIMAAFGAAIAESEKKLELERSEFAIREAKDLRTIFDMRAKAADKSNFTAKERQGFIEKAISLTISLGKQNEIFANKELALQQAVFNANKSNIDDEIELNKLKQKADEVAASSLKKQKLLIAELQTIKNQAAKEDAFSIDKVSLKEIEAIDKEIEAQQKLDDELLKMEEDFQDDIAIIQDKAKEDKLKKTDDFEKTEAAIKEQALNSAGQLASDIFANFQNEKIAKLKTDADIEKAILQQRLDDGVISEEQFAKEVAAIEQKQRTESAKAEKKKAIFDIAINTALAIIKAFATLGPIAGVPAALAIAGVGAIQAAAIAAKPIPKFADGGEIGGNSHAHGGTILEGEKGEFVVKKSSYTDSKDVVNMVNDGILTDRNFNEMTSQSDNMLIAGLLMNMNDTNKQMLTALLNGGHTVSRNGLTEYMRNDGTIEKFLNG